MKLSVANSMDAVLNLLCCRAKSIDRFACEDREDSKPSYWETPTSPDTRPVLCAICGLPIALSTPEMGGPLVN